jgi:hypothetical protein
MRVRYAEAGGAVSAELEALRQRSLKAKWRETIGDMEVPSNEELKAMQQRGEMLSDKELALAVAERAVIEAAVHWGTVRMALEFRQAQEYLRAHVVHLIRLRAAQESGTQEILDK